MAAVLACGEGAVLSHRTAAEHWGIWQERASRSAAAARAKGRIRDSEDVVVTVPASGPESRPSITTHRRNLPPSDLTVHNHIPVTTPARTLLDLASAFNHQFLEHAINAADRLDLVDPESLRAYVATRPGQPGAPSLRRLLDRDTFVLTDSDLERRFLAIARRAGLPKPDTGARLHGYRVDFHWPELDLVVETDGLRYHRTPAQQAQDRRRDQVLAAAGITVLRFTHAQVARHPREVAETLRRVATPRRTRGRSR